MKQSDLKIVYPGPLILFYLISVMLHATCQGHYMKPYDAGSSSVNVIIPPKPNPEPPISPVKINGYTGKRELPKDVKTGGTNSKNTAGWGISFNIWVWVDKVKPATESFVKWHFKTTTVPPVKVQEWYTTERPKSWGSQVRAFDDSEDQAEKKSNGLQNTCFSWQDCFDFEAFRKELREARRGKMRSIGGATDSTDNAIIAFIVIVVVAAAGAGGFLYWQKRNASLAELEDDLDEEMKEELTESVEKEREQEGEEAA